MKTPCLTSMCSTSFRSALSIVIWSILPLVSWAQPGKDGPVSITTANTVVNCYSAVTANVNSGTTTITTDNNCTLTCGDLIMVYQAQGASITTSNTTQYGDVSAYNNSGLYEFNYVLSNAGGVLTVQSPWTNNYSASGMTQVIKVPQYTTLNVSASGSIVASPWQDAGAYRKGGIVVIHATGTVTVNGTIHANGLGFRPGVMDASTGNTFPGDFVSNNSAKGGEKGESIAGFNTQYDALGGRYGIGSPANGGGGGGNHNAGAGGGSNASNGNTYNGQGVMCTSCTGAAAWSLDTYVVANGNVLTNSSGGGRGGYSYCNSNQDALTLGPNQSAWGGDSRKPNGGWGGKALSVTASSRIFFGGGGGAGDANNGNSLAGGAGGGIVFIAAPNVSGTGTISANGADAPNQISTNNPSGNDGASGGGGGGTVIVKSNISNSIIINAKGGKGGDQNNGSAHGSGGGGGGGFVAITSGSPTVSVAGGANGITLAAMLSEFPSNGATSGASGQSTTVTYGILSHNPLSLTATATPTLCAGNTVSLTSSVNYPGGTFAWTGPQSFTSTLQNPSVVTANTSQSGSYQVIYTSPGGCKDTAVVSSVIRPQPVIAVASTNPLCAGTCNGSATVNFTTAGTSPYTFTWNNGQTAQTASNLCPGTYSVSITDASGCTAAGTTTLTSPTAISATASAVSISCFGMCNGSITVSASGGAGSYQYSLNGGPYQSSNVFNSLCMGSYTITVKDANNCTLNVNATINQPTQLSLALVSTVPTTCGTNNGSITVAPSGGTAPYTYSIGGSGQAFGTFTNLAAGSYTVTVTDANGCTQSVNASVTTVVAPTAFVLTQQNVSCFGGINGNVLIGITGGNAPYMYTLNSGTPQASNLFTGLAAGTYTVTVSDVNSCTTTTNVTIAQPAQMTFTTTMIPVTCNGLCDGSIIVNVTGGTAPYTYSKNNGATFSAINPLAGLCAGIVDIVVQDSEGCLSNSSVLVTQPTPIAATWTTVDPTCHNQCNGQLNITATGGVAGYTYSVGGGAFQSASLWTTACPGPQTVTVRDGNGCEYNQNVTIANPPEIVTSQTSMIESNCGFNNGYLEVTASGPHPPFQYALDGGAYQTNGVFSNLYGGAYIVYVQDAIGCMDSTYFGVNDVEMAGIVLSMTDVTCFGGSDGSIEVTNVSGALPITYEFDNSGITQTNGNFTGLAEGSHVVAIYDGGLCAFTLPFMIMEPTLVVYTPLVTDATCFGGADGQIELDGATGGTGTYQYSVDNGSTFFTDSVFTGLSAGLYDLVVKDGNNCTFYQQATIGQTTPVAISANSTSLNCFGDNNAFIQLDGSGGNGGYQYSIDNGANMFSSAIFTGLTAGTYDIVVSDSLGCFGDTTITISQPPQLTATYSSTPELCSGSCDGTITSTPTGGTGTYMFSTDNGVTYGINNFLSPLCPGTYNVIIADQNLCQFLFTDNVAAAPSISITKVITPSTCGNANGSITLTGNGGSGGYSYSIDNGATLVPSGTFNGLNAGTYTVSVQDGNGCLVDSSAIVLNLASPTFTGVFATAVTCNGICDGAISATATGGSGNLQYSIGGAYQIPNNFNALCAGNYIIVVIDTNGCTDTNSLIITEPAALAYTSMTNNPTCNSNPSGVIMLSASGGTTPYQYSYNNGASFTSSSSLQYASAGTYDVVIKDANNCTVNTQFTLTEPAPLTASVAVTDAMCNGYCDGTAIVTVAGGTGPGYTYTWSPNVSNSTGNQASTLCAGTYWVHVSDQNGCLIDDTFAIAEPPLFEISNVTFTQPNCNGDCNGSITINAPGAMTYSFDGGTSFNNANTATNICSGSYNLVATDAIGCFAYSSVFVTSPAPQVIFSTSDSLMCTGDTIPLYAVAFGGTAPYQYFWNNGVIGQSQDVHPTTPTNYSVTFTDAHGCTSPSSTTALTMLDVLSIDVTPEKFICAGNTTTLAVNVLTGAPDYSYSWNTGPNDTLSTVSVTPVAPTTYNVTVKDICVSKDTSVSILFYPAPQIASLFTEPVGCAPFTVTPDTTGMSSMSDCLWTFSDGQVFSGCDNVSVTFTEAGCYDLTYIGTTVNGCLIQQTLNNIVCVNPTPQAKFTYGSGIPTIFNNSLNFYDASEGAVSYQWNFVGFGGSSLQNPTYTFLNVQPDEEVMVCEEVISDLGCTDTTCQIIRFQDELIIHVPNAFTPDGTEFNNTFYPVFQSEVKLEEYKFQVYNRWGEVVFSTNDYKEAWDGTYKGLLCPSGTYVWVIELRDGYQEIQQRFTGSVSMLY